VENKKGAGRTCSFDKKKGLYSRKVKKTRGIEGLNRKETILQGEGAEHHY
jgi:hypothetical protein